jgi:hypothetical protein
LPRVGGTAWISGISGVTSLRLPPVSVVASGMPCASTITWCLLLALPRSTGETPVAGPPFIARWPKPGEKIELRLGRKKSLRPHQTEAVDAVFAGFADHDRGKLIMACGTGKTFTSLKVAERSPRACVSGPPSACWFTDRKTALWLGNVPAVRSARPEGDGP